MDQNGPKSSQNHGKTWPFEAISGRIQVILARISPRPWAQENILVVAEEDMAAEITVKLIDFGFGSRILEGVKLRAKVGTFVRLGRSN